MASIPPAPPKPDLVSSAGQFWTLIDKRVNTIVQQVLLRWGKPRSRVVTINFPIAGKTTPLVGWIASVGIAHNIKIVGWSINAIVSGQVVVDVQVSTVPASSFTTPALVSLPGAAHFPSMNFTFFGQPRLAFTAQSQDTSGWVSNQVSAGSFLHVFIVSATTIAQAVLVLRVIDTDSKTLQQ